MGVNPSLIINKGIYIQHVDGGLYTKENWSNKGYSNDLCNGIALVDKVCFVIGTEDVGSHDWGVDGEIDDIFFQNTTYMQTVLKDYWGRENQNAYLEYDTSNLNCSFRSANKYLFKNGQNGYVGGAGEFQLVLLYANEINECLLMVGGMIMSNKMWTSTQSLLHTHLNNSRSLLLIFRFCLFEYADYLVNNIRIRHFLNKNIHCLSYIIGFFFFKSYFSTGNSIR